MNLFNFVKSRVTIFDVVNEYATLKRAGTYWKARCPFHHEKTASFTVSPGKEIFYCFGCHIGGDAISFIAQIENCSQLEAAQFLADRYNIELPTDIELHEHDAEQKKQYYEICKAFASWCHTQLNKHPSIQKYLADRKIDKKQIDYFTIGYFPGGLSAIKQCLYDLKKNHILADDLLQAQIFSQGKSVLYSPFEDRIIFPIKDHMGRFCAFGGRVFKPSDTRAKYYNSRENEYFTKGSLLFGLDLAKKSIQKKEYVFLVEGYTDCIAMVQYGYPNTVATLGTACTLAHLKQLSRHASYLYLLYDNDQAGHKAVLRLTQLCWQANMELKVIVLPKGQDPASYLSAGNDLSARINAAQDIFEFYIESQGAGFALKSLNEKLTLTKNLVEIINTIGEPLKIDLLLQKAAACYEIPFDTLKAELQRAHSLSNKNLSVDTVKDGTQGASDASEQLEKRIFCAIINDINLLENVGDSYLISYMPEQLGEILQKLKRAYTGQGSFEFAQFFVTLSPNEKQYVSRLLLENEEKINQEAFQKLIIQFHKKKWKEIVVSIQGQLQEAKQQGNTQKMQKILHDFQSLKKKIIPAITHQ